MSLAITPLAEVEQRFGLSRTEDETFFPEWQTDLPALSVAEQTALDEVRRRQGQLLEGDGDAAAGLPPADHRGFL